MSSNKLAAYYYHRHGITLIELVLSIFILAICLTGTMLVFITIVRSSVDPMIQQQAINIGTSYLEEIMAKEFPATVPCSVPAINDRRVFANVCDYRGLNDAGAKDQNNQLIASLAAYNVAVNIDTLTAVLGILHSGTEVVRIDVTVTHPNLRTAMVISGYRTQY